MTPLGATPKPPGLAISPQQKSFLSGFTKTTGLDPNVSAAWLRNEEPAISQNTDPAGHGRYNFLNVGITDNKSYSANSPYWNDPIAAGRATGNWLAGRLSLPGYGKSSGGIQGITKTAGLTPLEQIRAIQQSGWSSSGEKALPSLYQQALGGGGIRFPALQPQTGAATAPATTPPSTPLVGAPTLPTLTALQGAFGLTQRTNQNALDALGKISGRQVQAAAAPDLASLIQAQIPALAPALTAPTALKPIVQKPTAVPVTTTKRGATIGGIVNQQNLGRTDMGVDFRGRGAIPAFASGIVTRVDTKNTGWPGATGANSGAMITYKITSGPNAGRFVYIAESLVPHVKVGQKIAAGQTIATALGTGAMTEMGWAADANGTTLAHATTGYTEGQVTNAGKSFRTYLGL